MQLERADEAHRILLANLSPRYHRLDVLERYVDGTQYEGRPSFWSDDVPVFERAPCVVYPIVKSAIQSNADLCVGQSRWPSVTSLADEDDAAFDDRFGLDEAQSETLDRFVAAVSKQARLQAVAREILAAAQGCGTAVAIVGVRNGRLCLDTTRAKWCTPTFDATERDVVTKLEIRYPFLEEYKDKESGKWSVRCMLYRRVIDDARDVTYEHAKANDRGDEPNWQENPDLTVSHGLGFCPVVWYRFLAECSTAGEVDGQAVHARLLDELDALNFALSLRHRGSLYASDPQVVEIGVDDDHNPAPTGREARIVIPGQFNEQTGGMSPRWYGEGSRGQPKSARRRGCGVVWRYPQSESTVELLSLPGDAMKPADDNARDLRSKIAEALSVVFTDPENMKTAADISGRALREHHKRQLERCDVIRDDFGHGFLLPVHDMLLRVSLQKQDGLYLPGVKKAAPILSKFQADVEGVGARWFSPAFTLDWGEYFALSGADKKADIEAVLLAKDGGLITRRTAVEEMRDYFTIGNVDQYVEALEEEAETKAAEAHDAEVELIKAAKPPPMVPGQKPDPMTADDDAA